MSELLQQIDVIIASETAYAAKRQQQGDFAQAKLVFAAIREITQAVHSVGDMPEDKVPACLEAALQQARQQYIYDWNDQDGVGSSSFSRILRLLQTV